MRLIKKVNQLEVKRSFVVANFISNKKDRRKHLNFVPKKVFLEKLKNAKEKVLKLKEFQLDSIIKKEWGKRLNAYNESEWYLGEVKTTEVGVWRRAGGLPLSWTNGSLAETAKKVKYAIDHNPKLLIKRSRYSIPNILRTNVNFLQKNKYLLPIIFKGGTGTKARKRLRQKMKGDIDDGCMRSIALAISGRKTLKAYIGFPK